MLLAVPLFSMTSRLECDTNRDLSEYPNGKFPDSCDHAMKIWCALFTAIIVRVWLATGTLLFTYSALSLSVTTYSSLCCSSRAPSVSFPNLFLAAEITSVYSASYSLQIRLLGDLWFHGFCADVPFRRRCNFPCVAQHAQGAKPS